MLQAYLFNVAIIFFILVGISIYAASAAWAVGDAQRRGRDGGIVILLLWLFGPFSALVWFLVRPTECLANRAPDSFENADEALAAATRLDTDGDWDQAAAIYEDVALRWPEHTHYARSCLETIARKRSLGET